MAEKADVNNFIHNMIDKDLEAAEVRRQGAHKVPAGA